LSAATFHSRFSTTTTTHSQTVSADKFQTQTQTHPLVQFSHVAVAGMSSIRRQHRALFRDIVTLSTGVWDTSFGAHVAALAASTSAAASASAGVADSLQYRSVLAVLGSIEEIPQSVRVLA
jgi:hypothetical protein